MNKKKLLAGGIVLVFVFLVAATLSGRGDNNAQKPYEKIAFSFVEQLLDGEITSAYRLLNDSAKAEYSEAALEQYAADLTTYNIKERSYALKVEGSRTTESLIIVTIIIEGTETAISVGLGDVGNDTWLVGYFEKFGKTGTEN